MTLEVFLARLTEFGDYCRAQLASRDFGDWFLYFVPVVLFLEIPRYYFPVIGLFIARWLDYPRPDKEAERAILARAPMVSVVLAGRNEGEHIERTIQSLLDQDYPNYEILVVDDNSEDAMPEVARRYASRGLIRFIRNDSSRGRGGRPTATNIGLLLARGEFIVSLDADTSYGRSILTHLVRPFADPRVGVVAGNVLPNAQETSMLGRLQAIEYLTGIDLYKQWTHLFGSTLQASGAVGAFRRAAVADIGGWNPELAEDTDVSLRMIKAGWRVAFAPKAVARTDVPGSMRALARQRARWDRGGLRTFLLTHYRLMNPLRAGFAVAYELVFEMVFFIAGTLFFPIYVAYLLWQSPFLFGFVSIVSLFGYTLLSLSTLIGLRFLTDRAPPIRTLVLPALVLPIYKEWLRWVRVRAFAEELLLVRVEDGFLPTTAWANKARF